jgi:hypothetical protein
MASTGSQARPAAWHQGNLVVVPGSQRIESRQLARDRLQKNPGHIAATILSDIKALRATRVGFSSDASRFMRILIPSGAFSISRER